ncbi:MAG: hypothetical protein PHW62_00500 [Candidatus Ratteibacteria bacterium]|nr:hypothetical protein [Candidatus Ratteibacteria bacterium]
MIELNITPEDIANAEETRKNWLNQDGTLNVHKMQADIKKSILKANKRTMRWQEWARRVGLIGSTPTD